MLPLILTLALSGPVPTPADGSYTYVTAIGGSPVATTTIVVKHDAGGMELDESGTAQMGGQNGSAKTTMTLAPSLDPLSYTASYVNNGKPYKASVTVSGTSATETGDVASTTAALSGGAQHFVVLDLGPFSGYFALPAQMRAWGNAPAVALVPAYGHSVPIAIDTATAQTRPPGVPSTDAAIVVNKPVAFTIWYDPTTLIPDRMDVPSQGAVVTRKT